MTTQNLFNLNVVDESWQNCIIDALEQMDAFYLKELAQNKQWLPGRDKIFSAFSLPVNKVKYVLFGESPYPRAESANGYAFWDDSVHDLWSTTGLSKAVNRATSLRNMIKMLLIAENQLDPHRTSQDAIAKLNKEKLIQTNKELFTHFLNHGFLLLNAALVLQPANVRKDARAWQPFLQHILYFLFNQRPHIILILFGKIANEIDDLVDHFEIKRLYAEHPYNLTFL